MLLVLGDHHLGNMVIEDYDDDQDENDDNDDDEEEEEDEKYNDDNDAHPFHSGLLRVDDQPSVNVHLSIGFHL